MLELLLIIFVVIPILYWLDVLFFSDRKDEISAEITKPKLNKFSNQSIPDEIRKYKKMFEEGVIDKEEYKKKKKELLK